MYPYLIGDYYHKGYYSKEDVKVFVVQKWITEEDYKNITEEDYKEEIG